MSDDKIIDFMSRTRNGNQTPSNDDGPFVTEKKSGPEGGLYEFHLYGTEADPVPAPVFAEGYLKFGPHFIAVTEGPEPESTILFAAQTNVVKFLQRVDELYVEDGAPDEEVEDGAPDV